MSGRTRKGGRTATRPGSLFLRRSSWRFTISGSVQTDFRFCDNELRYRLLSRCVQDCKYFLGPGSRFSKYLWGGSVASHIKAMHILWDSFSPSQKPEWTSLEDIEDFSKKMMVEEVF